MFWVLKEFFLIFKVKFGINIKILLFEIKGYLQDVNEPVEYLKNYLQSVSK